MELANPDRPRTRVVPRVFDGARKLVVYLRSRVGLELHQADVGRTNARQTWC